MPRLMSRGKGLCLTDMWPLTTLTSGQWRYEMGAGPASPVQHRMDAMVGTERTAWCRDPVRYKCDRTTCLPIELFGGARLFRLENDRAVHRSDTTRLRGQGPHGHRHLGTSRVGKLRNSAGDPARSRSAPVLGQSVRAADVREAADAVAGR